MFTLNALCIFICGELSGIIWERSWEFQMANKVAETIIWLKEPTLEQRQTAISRKKVCGEGRELWAVPSARLEIIDKRDLLLAAIDAQVEAYTCELEATRSHGQMMAGSDIGSRLAILSSTIDRLGIRRHQLAGADRR